jgi:hypothetical protein
MTALCAIPTCRLRGRHLPGCDSDGCTGCLPRVAEAGNCCDVCVSRAAAALTAIITLTPDARSIAYGEVRRSTGGGSNKPGSRSPGNDDAMDALDAVQNALTTLAREIADVRGLTFGAARPLSSSVAADNHSLVARPRVDDPRGSQTRTDSEERVA